MPLPRFIPWAAGIVEALAQRYIVPPTPECTSTDASAPVEWGQVGGARAGAGARGAE